MYREKMNISQKITFNGRLLYILLHKYQQYYYKVKYIRVCCYVSNILLPVSGFCVKREKQDKG